jgi:hypothetical protein
MERVELFAQEQAQKAVNEVIAQKRVESREAGMKKVE